MTRFFPPSELIINQDGSVFHLELKPEHLADHVILVGDPDRVEVIASFFDTEKCRIRNREFYSITGTYMGKNITVISTGIGTDNIDIVLNELDALANIDFNTRTEKKTRRPLKIVRIGTCGSIQPDIKLGSFLISEKSVGIDGMLNFYADRNRVTDAAFEKAFCEQTGYSDLWAKPYVVSSDQDLMERIGKNDMEKGVTVTLNGFYGPQGRRLRMPLACPDFNARLEAFRYEKYRITNLEMESAGVEGMAAMMGHRAMTVCMVIANRYAKEMETDYKSRMKELIEKVLDRI